ncbi:hypothetical protein D8B26_005254 [Coccidioides posadasii str. Silveira]|uniref:NADH:ubiquinone oxidoreductase intermediate-associated protein 30 domain-containing protein n=3 Tax=Coccidioides posadasii TaxID=199306 RepID=E9D4P8_COCPS|nr:hypothetical protein CPC735_057990 [Coccidioides posadasii C735 delta SOWgp]EER24429.1 hypothetical protein CPC735_057990 [Coccidioides posadasii C735 delta SOWgp]EFW18480.1 hypothetical protein CPSG_05166 [Coccidioides posadasii str. Silveira]KMM66141.1 complex I intermediate-associated protein 30 [Coccidioides posadasii RMSCC 3488]QVM10597.1 hypothetical protein D8B26_005254 [Coccidioides posadasii str. Silveira]|eukprot:XP_003066574.1 hypothetical protein CPC735_057990 [Coccidioides posadasii C735 delta SOWgp]
MIPTAKCLARGPGFVKRTADELSRLSKLAWNMETLEVPTKPFYLLNFEHEDVVKGCKTIADRAVGGYSTASLDYVPADLSTNSPAHARFHGTISTKLPPNWRIQRTGYAAFRNQDRRWIFGGLYWDMDPYAFLALRVKSDGRRYTVNVQTDSIVETDIHQHRLWTHHHRIASQSRLSDGPLEPLSDVPPALADFPSSDTISTYTTTPNPDSSGWETIFIKWNDFVRTNYGKVVEPQTGMVTQRVKSIGIGLTDRVEGPYDLRIHRMWATNGLSKEEMDEERRICGANALGASTTESRKEAPSLVDAEDKGLDRFRDLKGLQKKDGGE